MNTEELRKQYEQLLRGAPDVLTPAKVVNRMPFSESHKTANAKYFHNTC